MSWAYRHRSMGERVKAKSPEGVLKPGDVVYVETKAGQGEYLLRQPPKCPGGLVAMDPQTGRVLAMVGGFSYAAVGIQPRDAGDAPAGLVVQAVRLCGGARQRLYAGIRRARCADRDRGRRHRSGARRTMAASSAGPSTLRLGIEKSRNLMTVRLANDMGMNVVAEYAERFGIYDKMLPVLAMSLGSGETTVLRMVSAYSVHRQWRQADQAVADRPHPGPLRQDDLQARGARPATAAMPRSGTTRPNRSSIDNREQVLDPMTAYQITSMMEGVVQRGTAAGTVKLDRPIAGKTGTTNDEKDAWFIGFTPDLVAGLYLGFDKPQPLGKGATGGGLAAPVFKEFMQARRCKGTRPVEFLVPEGMKLIAINRKTGMRGQRRRAGHDHGSLQARHRPGRQLLGHRRRRRVRAAGGSP